MLEGAARKIGLVFSAGTFLPWFLIVIGFGLLTLGNGIEPIGSSTFPYWMISIGGIPLIAVACVHAVVSTPGAVRILRAVTTVMSVIFLLCLGMVFFSSGSVLVFHGISPIPETFLRGPVVLFTGALLATIAWTAQMVLWVFYEEPLQSPQ